MFVHCVVCVLRESRVSWWRAGPGLATLLPVCLARAASLLARLAGTEGVTLTGARPPLGSRNPNTQPAGREPTAGHNNNNNNNNSINNNNNNNCKQ